jgi:amino acid transporter/nucleotide-binding universal stress UspA family protein
VELDLGEHRPRNVGWGRAAALLYGDWGTSKAYVLGLAFAVAGFSSLPIILAVCALTGLVGINYLVVCRHFPDGGGVYSAARVQGRLLGVVGALLLVADLTVTAALSGWSGLDYFNIPFLKAHIVLSTIGTLLLMGWLNWFGPKHSGSMAVLLSVPVGIVVIALVAVSVPHLTLHHLEPLHEDPWTVWKQFVGTILALSGVEAIANMTGVLKLNPDATSEKPNVSRESTKAILPVALEVVFGTALLGWAMLSIPQSMKEKLIEHKADMLRLIAEYFGTLSVAPWFGQVLGWVTGMVYFLLLISAANTAIVAMVGVFFMMSRDGEMPKQFKRLNSHGVPIIPLVIAVTLPIIVLVLSADFEILASLYAIGVVGAITLNLGSCTFNKQLALAWWERILFGGTFVVLLVVELTLAHEKHEALFFVMCILIIGLGLRAFAQKKQGLTTLTVTHEVARIVSPETIAALGRELREGQKIMVAARGLTPVVTFALEEAQLRKAMLCVLFVKELAIAFPGGPIGGKRVKWQDDPEAAAIMSLVLKAGQDRGVTVAPVFAVSEDPSTTILDLAATLAVDILMLGAAHRLTMARILKGNVVERVAAGLPEDIQLVIYG